VIELKEKTDVRPSCPHCSEQLDELWFQELKGFLGRRYVYFCGRCQKILGVSHRKGFWMG
jgi:DNA-directed RNA polymerase subunit RPC12/RpoP